VIRFIFPVLAFCLAIAPPARAQLVAAVNSAEPAEGPFVRLMTDEIITGETIILEPVDGKPQYLIIDGRSFSILDVHSFRADGQVYAFGHIYRGRPAFLVQVENGRAQLFRETNNRADGAEDYFSIGSGPIKPATGRYLREAFAHHPDALRHLQRERVYGYLGTGAFVLGAGLVLAGTALQFGEIEGPWPSGVIIAGTGVGIAAVINTIVPGARAAARREAIREFNRYSP
jgi:hypothetical protein